MSKNDSGYIKRPLPQKFLNLGLALLAVGLALGIIAYIVDPQRASFSYLTSFMFLISLGVGSLFWFHLNILQVLYGVLPSEELASFLQVLSRILLLSVFRSCSQCTIFFTGRIRPWLIPMQCLKEKSRI